MSSSRRSFLKKLFGVAVAAPALPAVLAGASKPVVLSAAGSNGACGKEPSGAGRIQIVAEPAAGAINWGSPVTLYCPDGTTWFVDSNPIRISP